ncbi:MAG: hypothetical protein WDW36_004675 [Sanguina aurantia]
MSDDDDDIDFEALDSLVQQHQQTQKQQPPPSDVTATSSAVSHHTSATSLPPAWHPPHAGSLVRPQPRSLTTSDIAPPAFGHHNAGSVAAPALQQAFPASSASVRAPSGTPQQASHTAQQGLPYRATQAAQTQWQQQQHTNEERGPQYPAGAPQQQQQQQKQQPHHKQNLSSAQPPTFHEPLQQHQAHIQRHSYQQQQQQQQQQHSSFLPKAPSGHLSPARQQDRVAPLSGTVLANSTHSQGPARNVQHMQQQQNQRDQQQPSHHHHRQQPQSGQQQQQQFQPQQHLQPQQQLQQPVQMSSSTHLAPPANLQHHQHHVQATHPAAPHPPPASNHTSTHCPTTHQRMHPHHQADRHAAATSSNTAFTPTPGLASQAAREISTASPSLIEIDRGVLRVEEEAEVSRLLSGRDEDAGYVGGGGAGPPATDGMVVHSTHTRHWVYPSSPPPREYQYQLVRTALFTNTLVVLPTGLGKTLVAAVVMYNYYRWFPQGKIVFLAPTKPLVEQQLMACINTLGAVPKDDFIELSAKNVDKRKQQWLEKRIFFCTAQILDNDLLDGTCPAKQIVCLVVDECHKAVGDASVVKAVQQLRREGVRFRMLGLSATPGSSLEAIQSVGTKPSISGINAPGRTPLSALRGWHASHQSPALRSVVSKLAISRIGFRSHDSEDVAPYTHPEGGGGARGGHGGRSWRCASSRCSSCCRTAWWSFAGRRQVSQQPAPEVPRARSAAAAASERNRTVPQPSTGSQRMYDRMDVEAIDRFSLVRAQDAFFAGHKDISKPDMLEIKTAFEKAMFLATQNELLTTKGAGVALDALNTIFTLPRIRSMAKEGAFLDLRGRLMELKKYPQPKMRKLEEVLLQHFQSQEADGSSKKVIIFTTLRESVAEIKTCLDSHTGLIMCRAFIGQSGGKKGGNGGAGMPQKEQKEVLQMFRDGRINTLIATCIGEEGLDIADVDLIVCYDSSMSPTRQIQRMGRTGRHREGRVVYVLNKGREADTYYAGQAKLKELQGYMMRSDKYLTLCTNPVSNPTMLPAGCNPQAVLVTFPVRVENRKSATASNAAKGAEKPLPKAKRPRPSPSPAPADPMQQQQQQQQQQQPGKQPSRGPRASILARGT